MKKLLIIVALLLSIGATSFSQSLFKQGVKSDSIWSFSGNKTHLKDSVKFWKGVEFLVKPVFSTQTAIFSGDTLNKWAPKGLYLFPSDSTVYAPYWKTAFVNQSNTFTGTPQIFSAIMTDAISSKTPSLPVVFNDSVKVNGALQVTGSGTFAGLTSTLLSNFDSTTTNGRSINNQERSIYYSKSGLAGKYTTLNDSSGDIYSKTLSAGINVHGVDLNGTDEWMSSVFSTSNYSLQPTTALIDTNTGFETNTTGWQQISGILTRQTSAPVLAGVASGRIAQSGNGGGAGVYGLENSKNYSISYLLRITTFGNSSLLRIGQQSGTGGTTSGTQTIISGAIQDSTYLVRTNWRSLSTSSTFPRMYISVGGNGATYRFDQVFINELQPFSISYWVKIPSGQTGYVTGIVRKGKDSTQYKGFALLSQDSATGKPMLIISDSLSKTTLSWGSAINDGRWHLVNARIEPHGTTTSGGVDSALAMISVDGQDSLTVKVPFIMPLSENDSIVFGNYNNRFGQQIFGETKIIKNRSVYNSELRDVYESGFSQRTDSVSTWYQFKTNAIFLPTTGSIRLSGRSVDSTGDQILATFPSRQSGKFYADESGNSAQVKATSDSLTVNGKINFLGITTDSTTCQRGQLWLKSSDGTIHVKY